MVQEVLEITLDVGTSKNVWLLRREGVESRSSKQSVNWPASGSAIWVEAGNAG